MAKKIGQYSVALQGPDGVTHTFAPGTDDYPDWAGKQMGPHCFEGGENLFNEDGKVQAVVHHDADEHTGDGPPPKSGAGSGVKAWRGYAEAEGHDVDGLDRDEIIAALEEAGVAVE